MPIPFNPSDAGLALLAEAGQLTGGDRQAAYGPPHRNHQATADLWRVYLARKYGLDVPLDARDVCLLNILQKVARDAHQPKRDNLVDLAGYAANAQMVEATLEHQTKLAKRKGWRKVEGG